MGKQSIFKRFKPVKILMLLLLGIGIFLFWRLLFPQALSYHEQYQLFLFTSDYFFERMSVAGGLADYIGEFLTQFYYVTWLGAFILTLLTISVFVLLTSITHANDIQAPRWQRLLSPALCLIPLVLLIRHQGDESVLLSYLVAIVMSLLATRIATSISNKCPCWMSIIFNIIFVPLLYWLVGAMAWLYVGLRVVQTSWRNLWMALLLLAVQLSSYAFCLQQYPFENVMLGIGYYRGLMLIPILQWFVPLTIIVIVGLLQYCQGKKNSNTKTNGDWLSLCPFIVVLIGGFFIAKAGFEKDKYELIWQDWKVRTEQWDDVVKHAQKYQVKTSFSSQCVNLALAKKRQLADRMFDFYQSGEDALFMPMVRDLTSDLPTAETMWHLGLVNEALRYYFDVQQSILNGRQSGRCMKRIAECYIINGNYTVARKYLETLSHSLFYSDWAQESMKLLGHEDLINAHPVYGRMRRLRFKEDFIFSYPEIDKVLGRLFVNNPDNKMALDYFMGELLLKGKVQDFMQYMGWVQQYGGYRMMPLGYQDAVRCIQQQGQVEGSPYAKYVQQMMKGGGQ